MSKEAGALQPVETQKVPLYLFDGSFLISTSDKVNWSVGEILA